MAEIYKLLTADYDSTRQENSIDQEQVTKELTNEPTEVWTQAIDKDYLESQHTNVSDSWIIDDNQDVLEDYMEEVSDLLLPEDFQDFDI